MQVALRSATRRAVGISARRGVATTTAKAATATPTASAPERDWLDEHEKAWVKAMVQREMRAHMVAEEERRSARDRLRAAEDEKWSAVRCRLADEARLMPFWAKYTLAATEGWIVGFWLAMLMFGR